MPSILVTGVKGQIGRELQTLSKHYPYTFYFTDRTSLDITYSKSVQDFITRNAITHIINCAAYTAVDRAEEEKELAELINHHAVENLAKICKEKDITLIHISTDYVFDGKSHHPYQETDPTDPINHYGLTKLQGEEAIQKIAPKGLIIRTSWVYSPFGKNFVKTMLHLAKSRKRLSVVWDQIGTPTYAKDLAKTILDLLAHEKLSRRYGEIYHYANEGICSWYDFAKAIFEIEGIDIKIDPIKTKEYPTPAKRPYFSVLDKTKIKNDFSITIPYWRDSLKECLQRLKNV